MSGMAKVIIMGRIGRTPELKYLKDGDPVLEIPVAVGDGKDHTSWFDCTFFGKTADNVAKYFNKGSRILLEGNLWQDKWEKDGTPRSKVKVKAYSFHFIDAKSEEPSEFDQRPAVEEEDVSQDQKEESPLPF